MDYSFIINIICMVLLVVGGFFIEYFKTKTDIMGNVADLIAQAEMEYADVTKSGGKKFQYCVDALSGLVPAVLKGVFTDEVIGQIVQNVFDAIKVYATQQLDKVVK